MARCYAHRPGGGQSLPAPLPTPRSRCALVLVAVALDVVLFVVFLVAVALRVVLVVLLVAMTLGVVEVDVGGVLLGHDGSFLLGSADRRLRSASLVGPAGVSRLADTGTVILPTHPCRRTGPARPAV